ncbi:MAG: hypothetical protein ACUVQ3_09820 [bacterium]
MNWRVHPAKANITKTVVSLVFLCIFLLLVAVIYGIPWALLGIIFLFVSLYSYYFPTTYQITEDKVIIKTIFTTTKRNLSEFKKVYFGKNGILLSPFKHKTFLNNFRGVFLLLPEDREEIIKYFKERYNPDTMSETRVEEGNG